MNQPTVVPTRRRSRRDALGLAAAAALAALWRPAAAQAVAAERIAIAGAALDLHFEPGFDAELRQRARVWVRRSMQVVISYFGRFPVPQSDLVLLPIAGGGVRGGVTFGEPSPLIRVGVGGQTTPAQFVDDWVLVHEMVHLAIPELPRAQRWFHEGVATYVESIARARSGLVSEADLWDGLVRGMPHGLPKAGDRGLDRTPTWGRTYWGGALFCLLADVQMRQRSGGRAGLQQALQGLLAAGASFAVPWPIERVLASADAAVGQATLAELYAQMKHSPHPVDLPALWRDLGLVVHASGAPTLSDEAPLAAVRRALLA